MHVGRWRQKTHRGGRVTIRLRPHHCATFFPVVFNACLPGPGIEPTQHLNDSQAAMGL